MTTREQFTCAAEKQLIEEAIRNKYLCPASQNILQGIAGRQNIPGIVLQNNGTHLAPGGTLQAASIRPKSPTRKQVPPDCDCGFYKFPSKPGSPLGKRLSLSSDLPEQVIPPPNYRRASGEKRSSSVPKERDSRRSSHEKRGSTEPEEFLLDTEQPSTSEKTEVNPQEAETTVYLTEVNPQEAGTTSKAVYLDPLASQMADRENSRVMDKMKMSQSRVLYALNMIREPVVDYQETRGVPRNEEITFVTLITSLCTQAYTAAITILVMLWNLMPLVDGFVYFVRFFLDKIIDIIQTEDNKERAIKGAILFAELTVIFFLIFMIVGLIFMPVYVLMARLFSKVFSMIAW